MEGLAGLNIDKINNNENNPIIETEANEYANIFERKYCVLSFYKNTT